MLQSVKTSTAQGAMEKSLTRGGFWRKAAGLLAATALLILPALGAMATSIPVGTSGATTLTGVANPVYFAWGIYDPSHTLIAAGGVPNPQSNGWSVNFTTSYSGGVTSINSISVTVPPTAGIGGGSYTVVVAGPPGGNTGVFDVVPNGPVSGTVVNGLTVTPGSIRGGDNATGTVSINLIAPSGGSVVSLTSSSTTYPNYALVSSTVTIPAGRSITTFNIPTLGTTSATITASAGGQSRTAGISVSSNPASDGSVRVGQSATFTPSALRNNAAYWAIYGPTGSMIASSGGPVPTNGWNVTFSTYYNGQTYNIPSITVTAPAGATVSSNYAVTVSGPSGNNAANFTVTY